MTNAFYAVQSGDELWRSENGITWNLHGTFPGAVFDYAFSDEAALWVAINGLGTLDSFTSTDGVTWTTNVDGLPQPGVGGTWRKITWCSAPLSKFVIVSSKGEAAYSADGLTWTLFDDFTDPAVATSELIYSAEQDVVVVTERGNAAYYISGGDVTGGGTWQGIGVTYSLAWSPDLSLWVKTVSDGFGLAYVSTSPTIDGSWTARVARSGVHHCACWGGDRFVVGGEDTGNHPNEVVAYSTDGINWTYRQVSGDPTFSTIAYSPQLDLFMVRAVGSNQGTYTSPDAHTWTFRGSSNPTTLIKWVTTNVAPNAPTLVYPTGAAVIDRTSTQRFDWTFSDPNPGDTQSKYDLRYRVVGAGSWTEVLDQLTPNSYHDFAGGNFTAGDFEWQVRTYDAQGEQGSYSTSSFFTAATPPSGPTITAPTNGATITVESYQATWSVADQDSYQIRRVADNAGAADTGTIYYDSGEVTSTAARSHWLTFSTNNRFEHVQLRVKDGGLWSSWVSVRVEVSYTPPATPTFTLTGNNPSGVLAVNISNPTPSGSEPTVSHNDVYVDDGDGEERKATGVAASATWTYYTPVSGRDYTSASVRVVAYGDNGTTAES